MFFNSSIRLAGCLGFEQEVKKFTSLRRQLRKNPQKGILLLGPEAEAYFNYFV
jgi:hypothetical protein